MANEPSFILSFRNWNMEMEYSWLGAENWRSILLRPVTRWKLLIVWSERCGRWASLAKLIKKGTPQLAPMQRNVICPVTLNPLTQVFPWRKHGCSQGQVHIRGILQLSVSLIQIDLNHCLHLVDSQSCRENWTELAKRVCLFWRVWFVMLTVPPLRGRPKALGPAFVF